MIFPKAILSFAFASVLLVGCKDKTTVASNDVEKTTSKKEIVAALKPETASFKIDGMVCEIGCAKTIEEKLVKMEGIQEVKVNFETKQATVNFDLDKLTSTDIVKAVETTGDGKTYKVSEIKTLNKA
ncbi:heavy-metal-associated domain-containing protein [Flavobacterium sp.]|uniref:heavy-metal-associated domain-containing protein n=1 Tax=Flavobacterium sp. TaxID=239 RepID=UPI0037523E86